MRRAGSSCRGSRSLALLAAALVAASLAGCHPRLGGTHAPGENGPASEPESSVPTSPAGEETSLSHFGLLTPLFPGVGSQAVTAPCKPDDFYGGCL